MGWGCSSGGERVVSGHTEARCTAPSWLSPGEQQDSQELWFGRSGYSSCSHLGQPVRFVGAASVPKNPFKTCNWLKWEHWPDKQPHLLCRVLAGVEMQTSVAQQLPGVWTLWIRPLCSESSMINQAGSDTITPETSNPVIQTQ